MVLIPSLLFFFPFIREIIVLGLFSNIRSIKAYIIHCLIIRPPTKTNKSRIYIDVYVRLFCGLGFILLSCNGIKGITKSFAILVHKSTIASTLVAIMLEMAPKFQLDSKSSICLVPSFLRLFFN